jgi:hypothetical protein
MKIVDVTSYSSRIPRTIMHRGKEESLFDRDKIINQIVIESVEDILPFITTDIKYSFRGQASSEWPLKTSIERFFNDRNIISNHAHFEEVILAKYRSEFSTFSNILGYDPNTQSTLDALADIQHYGGPTRLLDWTSSLNVALFFATFNNYKNTYAAVFCLRNLVLNVSTFDIREMLKGQPMAPGVAASLPPSLDKSKLLSVHSPTRKNDRLKNQQGFFTYPGSVEVSFEDALSYSLDDVPVKYHSLNRSSISEAIVRSGLIKILIPKAIMPEIRRYLTNSGLSMKILFPDYYGAIQSLYEISANLFQ